MDQNCKFCRVMGCPDREADYKSWSLPSRRVDDRKRKEGPSAHYVQWVNSTRHENGCGCDICIEEHI